MDPQVGAVYEVLEDLRGQLYRLLEGLEDVDVNRTYPGLQNTIGILLRHLAAAETYWVSGVAGGGSQERHRDAEFGREPLKKADLVAALRAAQEASERVLARLDAQDLQTPVQAQRARGPVQTTKGFALLHAVQHLAYHLGQIRLLAALARHARTSSPA